MLYLQNVKRSKEKLLKYDVERFENVDNSFLHYLNQIEVIEFRHLQNLKITFEHPVTVITGSNKIGKTSILLLIACSFENFMKIDSTSPNGELRAHGWGDLLTFTRYETANRDYRYKLRWRVGYDKREGEGKRLSTSRAWSGLGKKSSARSRINAKIIDRHVRLVDLERVLPLRGFSNSLYRKTQTSVRKRLNQEIEQAFSYIFSVQQVELYRIGSHVNKSCYLINYKNEPYSSYGTASGEEAAISILSDIIEAPQDSLILIDEIEAGFHPYIQRKLADVIQYISWRDKKQFIITTHSPTLLSAFPQESRKFIDLKTDGSFETINKISKHAAFSKMDAKAYPIINLYCEDEESEFIIRKIMLHVNEERKFFDRLVNVIKSGPVDQVKNDYERHKRNYSQMRLKIGYCCVFDGDHKNHKDYSNYFDNSEEFSFFIYPYTAPEKFLVRSYLSANPSQQLGAALQHSDHHSLFQEMINLGLSVDEKDALNMCFREFKNTPEYAKFRNEFREFLINTVKHFSKSSD
jgi:predicted ATPase